MFDKILTINKNSAVVSEIFSNVSQKWVALNTEIEDVWTKTFRHAQREFERCSKEKCSRKKEAKKSFFCKGPPVLRAQQIEV